MYIVTMATTCIYLGRLVTNLKSSNNSDLCLRNMVAGDHFTFHPANLVSIYISI